WPPAGRPGGRSGRFAWHSFDRPWRGFGGGGRGALFPPGLPGLSLPPPHRRGKPAVAREQRKARDQREPRGKVEATLASPGGGDRGGGHAGSISGLHRLQRKLRQLAGGVVFGRFARACLYSAAGAGQANLSISSAAATPARLALCSTRPNAVAASTTATNRIDGRNRLSNAAPSAILPNTE